MSDLLSRFEPGELIGLVAVVGGLLIPLICGPVAIITDYWHKSRRLEAEAALKQDMLNRGMSADEIKMVLEAGLNPSRKDLCSQYSGKT